MKITRIVFSLLLLSGLGTQAAIVTLKNSSRDAYDVQVMETWADEHLEVGKFKDNNIQPGTSPRSYNSYLKEITGFRWRKVQTKADGSLFCTEYMVVLPQPISRFNLSGMFEMIPENQGYYKYYFNKSNPVHYSQGPVAQRVYAYVKNAKGQLEYKRLAQQTQSSLVDGWVLVGK